MLVLSTVMQVVPVLFAFVLTALATPLAFTPRDAISPPITSPSAGSVWRAGESQTVTWDLSGLNGAQPSNPIGKIVLGTFINGQEDLQFESPIASGFNILDGNVTLTVPTVPTGTSYIVCLFGTSGDISAPFTIIGTDASSSSASASASTQVNAASSSNTLPPHQTTDPTTSVSLPPGVTQTEDPSSASTTSVSSTSASVSITSGVSATSSPSPSPSATALSTSATSTSTASAAPAASAASTSSGNSGARTVVTNVQLWSAISGALALFALL